MRKIELLTYVDGKLTQKKYEYNTQRDRLKFYEEFSTKLDTLSTNSIEKKYVITELYEEDVLNNVMVYGHNNVSGKNGYVGVKVALEIYEKVTEDIKKGGFDLKTDLSKYDIKEDEGEK